MTGYGDTKAFQNRRSRVFRSRDEVQKVDGENYGKCGMYEVAG